MRYSIERIFGIFGADDYARDVLELNRRESMINIGLVGQKVVVMYTPFITLFKRVCRTDCGSDSAWALPPDAVSLANESSSLHTPPCSSNEHASTARSRRSALSRRERRPGDLRQTDASRNTRERHRPGDCTRSRRSRHLLHTSWEECEHGMCSCQLQQGASRLAAARAR